MQLSALGVAISSMVTLAEILKNKQLAVETRVVTSLEEISSESRCAWLLASCVVREPGMLCDAARQHVVQRPASILELLKPGKQLTRCLRILQDAAQAQDERDAQKVATV